MSNDSMKKIYKDWLNAFKILIPCAWVLSMVGWMLYIYIFGGESHFTFLGAHISLKGLIVFTSLNLGAFFGMRTSRDYFIKRLEYTKKQKEKNNDDDA